MDRRAFLKLLGIGAATTATGIVLPEPVRRFWQVPRNAPVSLPTGTLFGINAGGYGEWKATRIVSSDIWLADRHGFTYDHAGDAFHLTLGEERFGFSEDAVRHPQAMAQVINRFSPRFYAEASDNELIVTAVDTERRVITLTGVGR